MVLEIHRNRRGEILQGFLPAIAVAALVAAAAFLDQVDYRHTLEGVATTGAVALGAGVLSVVFARPNATLALGPIGLFLLLFLLWSVIATLGSAVSYLSWVEMVVFSAFAVAFLAWRWCAEQPGVSPVVLPAFFVIIGLGVTGLMLYQVSIGMRPVGLFVNPNSAAALVNLFWPAAALLAVLAAQKGQSRRYFGLLAAFSLMVLAVSLDGSRAAFLAACGGLIVVLITAGVGLSAPGRRLALIVVLFGAAIALAQLLSNLDVSSGRDIGSRVASLSEPAGASSERLLQWAAAWEIIGEQPWLGTGPGTFWLAYAALRAPADGTFGSYVHNDYLEFWAERGVAAPILVFILALVCAVLFYRAVRAGRAGLLGPAALVAVGSAAAAISTAGIHGFFSYKLQLGGILLFLALHLADLERHAPVRAWVRIRRPDWRRPLIAATGLGTVTLAGLLLWLMAASERATEQGLSYLREGHYEQAEDAFVEARQRWAAPDLPWLHHVDVYRHVLRSVPEEEQALRRQLIGEALELLDEAEARNPYRAQVHLLRGMLYRDHVDLLETDPRVAFERALELDPRATQARTTYASYLLRRGELEAAHDLLEEGLAYRYAEDPKELWRAAGRVRLAVGDEEGAQVLKEQLDGAVR